MFPILSHLHVLLCTDTVINNLDDPLPVLVIQDSMFPILTPIHKLYCILCFDTVFDHLDDNIHVLVIQYPYTNLRVILCVNTVIDHLDDNQHVLGIQDGMLPILTPIHRLYSVFILLLIFWAITYMYLLFKIACSQSLH